MSYFSAGASPIHMPTQAKLVFDVSGAGDAVMATFAHGLVGALPIEQTMRLANIAAGIVVSKPGTATITLDELRVEAAFQEESDAFRKGGSRRSTKRELFASIGAGRASRSASPMGVSTSCTRPCRDSARRRAAVRPADRRSQCGRVRDQAQRTDAAGAAARLRAPQVLGAIDCVDLVIIFEDDTPYNLIGALMPDVLIKGADYAEDQIVGADVVRSAGGRVERVKLVEGQSTSELIRRAKIAPALLEERRRSLGSPRLETH